jgi:hypothetical protein
MDAIIQNDLDAMLADRALSVVVTIGASSTRGLVDQLDEFVQDGAGQQGQVRSTVVTIRKGSLAGLVIDAAVVVDGTNYKVRQIALSDDGLLQHFKVA